MATNQAGVEKKLVLLRRPSVRLCWRLSPGTKRAFKEGKLKATLAEPECIAEVKSSTSLEESSLPPSHPLSLFSSSLSLPLFSSFSLPPFHSFPLLLVLSPSFSSCLLLSLLTFRLIRLPPSQTSHPPRVGCAHISYTSKCAITHQFLSLTHPLNPLTSLLYSVSLHLLMLVAHTHTQMQDTTQDARSHAPITQNRRPMLKCHFLLCGFWRKKEDRCLTVHPAFIASDLWMKSNSRQDGPAVG